MTITCYLATQDKAIPISVIPVTEFSQWLETQAKEIKNWFTTNPFVAEPGAFRVIPNKEGELTRVLCCVALPQSLWSVGHLAGALPSGQYYFDEGKNLEAYAIAWGLGAYQFTRYKKPKRSPAKLYLPQEIRESVLNTVEAIYLVRDLINTPTDDMGPTELAQEVKQLCAQFQASFHEIVGEDLLKQNYASIYTVGRASDDAPRLLDMRWGNPKHPKVTLVGKGVCFDTGGLDLKGSAHMLLMKKDMGGAAHVLGLARMIMNAKLPIALRVLIPAVENSVSGNAYRPGDVIKSRQGLTVEIGNTDAEGRVVLSDALTEAVSEKPELLIDMATLTGAARVALGTELPAVFSNNDAVVNAVMQAGEKLNDPMWRMPLFAAYKDALESPIADLNNASSEPYGGAITAALFLQAFVPDNIPWMHFDLMAWNLRPRPGKPCGGEALAIRALFQYLSTRFR